MFLGLLGCGPQIADRTAQRVDLPRLASVVVTHVAPAAARHLTVEMRGRESLSATLVRAGVAPDESGAAALALSDVFDTVNPHPGLALDLEVARAAGSMSPSDLVGLSFQPAEDTQLSLWRGPGGAFRARRVETPVFTEPVAVDGAVDGSLYLSVVSAGVDPRSASDIEEAFGRRLDLSRDIESGDRFRLVFEQRRSAGGRALGPGDLIYVELMTRSGLARLYGVATSRGGVELVDGRFPGRPTLLRTPVVGARVSSGFGPRMHPILGFSRMHQGVDFAAAAGSPVLAAADGVVEEARWSGGYGRWLRIRHASALETGYAHLSAWAAGIAAGAAVRQGQVVGFVGATGLATGPHLHFEVLRQGRRIDPKLAYSPMLAAAGPGQRAFRAQMARIDAAVVQATQAERAAT